MNTETALITGASSGIGLHLANEFAEHGHPLILVAPVLEELEQVAAGIATNYEVPVRVIAQNLEHPGAASAIVDDLALHGISIDILVNNAGHGYRGKFSETPLERDLSTIHLNIEAVIRLTKLLLAPMIQRDRGRILNVASIAGFEPGPLMAVYHATKAFVLSWSEALSMELEDTSITVTALCPGATDTDFFPKAGMLGTRVFQGGNLMAPQDVAKAGYRGLMAGDLIVVPGGMNKVLVAARRVLTESAQARINQKSYQEVTMVERTRERGDVEAEATKREQSLSRARRDHTRL